MSESRMISVTVPKKMDEAITAEVKQGKYRTKPELIVAAIRKYLFSGDSHG